MYIYIYIYIIQNNEEAIKFSVNPMFALATAQDSKHMLDIDEQDRDGLDII